MKAPLSTLCVSLFAAWALAAPLVIVDKLSSQSDNASTHVRQTAQQTEVQSRPKFFRLSFLAPSRVSIERHPKIVVAEDGRRIQLPDNLAGAKSWETPNVLHFLTSLTHSKKLSPFPESSIMKEETRANMAEVEHQETIVELETKAERESWTYLPYMSQDNVLHFHCVRKAADTVMLIIPLAAAAMILVAILSSAFRYTYDYFSLQYLSNAELTSIHRCHALRVRNEGSIRLDDGESAVPSHSLQVAREPSGLNPGQKVDSSPSAIDEKREEM
ncbi:hypothetical protein F5Y05DRAFT_283545 [Hypoxylon sp. FL0543]|nr:hypothetical protein F5Y05DRAFT_283545 [Hypoxylon sp. FL0543]